MVFSRGCPDAEVPIAYSVATPRENRSGRDLHQGCPHGCPQVVVDVLRLSRRYEVVQVHEMRQLLSPVLHASLPGAFSRTPAWVWGLRPCHGTRAMSYHGAVIR